MYDPQFLNPAPKGTTGDYLMNVAFDVGFPAHDPNRVRKLTAVPLAEWRVVAGPPGLEIRSQIYAQFLNTRPRRKRRKKVSSGPQSTNSNFSQNNDDDSIACERTLREVRHG
jgi:hypothetical protein